MLCSLVAVEARPLLVGRWSPSTRSCVSLAARPLGEVGVQALAVTTSGASSSTDWPAQSRMIWATMASKLCGVTGTLQSGQNWVPELDVQQAQEGLDLGQRATVLAPAAADALLDGHRRRDAEEASTPGAPAGWANWRA